MPILFAYGTAGERPTVVRAHNSVDQGFFASDSDPSQLPGLFQRRRLAAMDRLT